MRGKCTKYTKASDKGKPPKWLLSALPIESTSSPIHVGSTAYIVYPNTELSKSVCSKILRTLKKRGFKVSDVTFPDFDLSSTLIVPNGWSVVLDYVLGNIKLYYDPKHYGKSYD